MKKVAIIFFMIFLSANCLLSVLAFNYGQSRIKHEIKKRIFSGIDDSLLVKVPIALADIDRTDDDFYLVEQNEFKYFGHMYDIVRREICGDTIVFFSIRDEMEEALIEEFVERGEDSTESSNLPSKDELLKLLSTSFDAVVTSAEQHTYSFSNIVIKINHKNYKPLSNTSEVPSPPPKYS